jgi:hypothetical protein
MPRRPALISQADVARAIRAAKSAGAAAVHILSDGTVLILIDPPQQQLLFSGSPKPADEPELML